MDDLRAIAGIGAALGLLACGSGEAPGDSSVPGDTAPAELIWYDTPDFGDLQPGNVVLVNVDTLRADALPPWGAVHATTPLLDARPGWITVERAVSTAGWTLPSTTSLLTAQDQHRHGIRIVDETGGFGMVRVPLLTTTLQEAGFATALFTGSEVLTQGQTGLADGFDTTLALTEEPGNATAVVDAALEWLDAVPKGQPFFLMLQPNDPHLPYTPEPQDQSTWASGDALPFDVQSGDMEQTAAIEAALVDASDEERAAIMASVRDVYDEQVLGVDRALDRLLAELDARGLARDTLVVLVSDHGESFYDGEPLQLGHGRSAREELVHVPLRFWNPALADAQARCVVSTMDVVPTLAELLSVATDGDFAGQSFLDGCRDHAFSSAYEIDAGQEQLTWVSVQSLDTQLAWDCLGGEVLAFDLATDPAATTPLAIEEVARGTELLGLLDSYAAEIAATLPGTSCLKGAGG